MAKMVMKTRMTSGMDASGFIMEAPSCRFRSFHAPGRGGRSPWQARREVIISGMR
jgi:hypothetical protein